MPEMGAKINCFTKVTVIGDAKVDKWETGYTHTNPPNGGDWEWWIQTEVIFTFNITSIVVECICLNGDWWQANSKGDAESNTSNHRGNAAGAKGSYLHSTFDYKLVTYVRTQKQCKYQTAKDGTVSDNPHATPENSSECIGDETGGPCGPFECAVNTALNGPTNVGDRNPGGSIDVAWDDAMSYFIRDELFKGVAGLKGAKVFRPGPGWCGMAGEIDCVRYHGDHPPIIGGGDIISDNNQPATQGNDNQGKTGYSRRTRLRPRVIRR